MNDALPCPCGSGSRYAACCGRLHAGTPAADAEQLMRSRYCAYVLGNADYLLRTWHPSSRPRSLDLSPATAAATRWLGLDVRSHRVIDTDHAEVEFVARHRIGGERAVRLHERSRFLRETCWYYLDGDVDAR